MLVPLLASLALAKEPPLRADLAHVHPLRASLELTLDPRSATFSGIEDLALTFDRPTRRIDLDAADLAFTSVRLGWGLGSAPLTATTGDDGKVHVAFDQPVQGEVQLHFEYSGLVSDTETQGVFRIREGEDDYLFTEFEPQDARRMFPSFDQPDAKIPWRVMVHVPDGLGAFANMPQTALVDEEGPLTTVVFAETPPLPSYLVALAVGPFDVVDAGTAGRNAVPVRIVVPRGRAADAGWAVSTTGPILTALEDWFDLPYGYPKLDVVALPEAVGFGAMENPGMITCVQDVVVARPEDDSVDRRRTYVEYLAHEESHLWFGDLVTLSWWDDLWLNESFASWMGSKMVERTEPDWGWDLRRAAERNGALGKDSLASARRIREPIRTPGDIENAFDGITYGKGQAVLEMIEAWVGEETFREGVHAYLLAHANGNATTTDFVGAVSAAAGRDLAPVFAGFLDQVGAPEITVALHDRAVSLTQHRFVPEGSTAKDERWSVPVCLRWADDAGEHRSCTLLAGATTTLPLEGSGAVRWLVPNAGSTGYYRTRLDAAGFTRLLDPATPLTGPERIGVLGDATAAVSAGTLDASVVLERLRPLIALGLPQVTGETVGVVASLDQDLVPDELRPSYLALIRTLYGETAERLGLAAVPGESAEDKLLRPKIARVVGDAGRDPVLLAAARPLADQWLTDRTGLDPDLVDAVLDLAAIDGDRALFDRIHAAAKAEPDRERRSHLLTALGAFRDPALATAALDVALSGEFDVRETFGLVLTAIGHRETRDATWAYVKDHIDEVEKTVPPIARGYLPWLGGSFCDAAHRAEVEAFFRPRVGRWIGGPRQLDQVLEGIDLCVASVQRQEPSIRAVLATFPPPDASGGDAAAAHAE